MLEGPLLVSRSRRVAYGSEKTEVQKGLSKHVRKKVGFCVRQACPKGDGPTWGVVPGSVLATLEPRMTFSSPAKLGETPPVRIVTFSHISWGKSLLSDFPGPSGIPAENFRRDRGTAAKNLTPCVLEARWRIYFSMFHKLSRTYLGSRCAF